MEKVWKHANIPRWRKLEIFEAMVVSKLRAREFYGAEDENGVFFEVVAVLAYRDLPPTVRETAPAGSEAEPWYHSVFWEEQDGKNGAGRGSEHGGRDLV